MATSKLKDALEQKKSTMKEALTPKVEESEKKELSETAPEELQEETQGGDNGKSPDELIEENLVMLMNLDEKKHNTKETITAIAHLAVTTLILKKAIDVLSAKDTQLAQAMGELLQGHQAHQAQTANIMQGMHNKLQTMQPSEPAPVTK